MNYGLDFKTCMNPLLFLSRIYDMDNDGYISNGELFQVLALKSTNTKRHFPSQQALSLSCPGVEDDGGKQLERHPAAAGDQFTISLVHADILYEN